MQPWDYLVFIPVLGAGYYLWQKHQNKTGGGACSSCSTAKGCSKLEKRKGS